MWVEFVVVCVVEVLWLVIVVVECVVVLYVKVVEDEWIVCVVWDVFGMFVDGDLEEWVVVCMRESGVWECVCDLEE